MRTTLLMSALVFTCLCLVISNAFLSGTLDQEAFAGKIQGVVHRLERRSDRLSAEAARLERQLAVLKRISQRLKALQIQSRSEPETSHEGAASQSEVDEKLEELLSQYVGEERPEPAQIPRLSSSEWKALVRERTAIPHELRGEHLLVGDLDALLSDPLWNPTGYEPSVEERAELNSLLKRYRYYARISPLERYERYVKPEIEFLRDAGAYVEYPEGEEPPAMEGVHVSHGEKSDREGMNRIYYFYPEDYPELAHHERVEQERGLETFLEIYYVLNGYPEHGKR